MDNSFAHRILQALVKGKDLNLPLCRQVQNAGQPDHEKVIAILRLPLHLKELTIFLAIQAHEGKEKLFWIQLHLHDFFKICELNQIFHQDQVWFLLLATVSTDALGHCTQLEWAEDLYIRMLSCEVRIQVAARANIGFSLLIVDEVFLRTSFENIGEDDMRAPHELAKLITASRSFLAVAEQIHDIDELLVDCRGIAIDHKLAPRVLRAHEVAVLDNPLIQFLGMHLGEAKHWSHLTNLLMQQSFVPLVIERPQAGDHAVPAGLERGGTPFRNTNVGASLRQHRLLAERLPLRRIGTKPHILEIIELPVTRVL